jgi:hypothetical protein
MSNDAEVLVQEKSAKQLQAGRFRGLLDIAVVFLPIVLFGLLGNWIGLETITGGFIVNIGYVVSIVVAGLVLKQGGTNWREIGLARPKSWFRTTLLALGAFVGAIVLIVGVQMIALSLPGVAAEAPDVSRFDSLVGNVPFLLLMLTLAWTIIAFGEEMIYRAYIINRLGDVFGHEKVGLVLAVITSGVIFGLAHFAEGPVGLLTNGAFGLLFGWIYLKSGRNLWITIIAHGLLNTLRFVLVFAGAA